MVKLLTNEDVAQLVSVAEILDVFRDMYEELGEGKALTRPRTDVHAPAKNDGEYYWFRTMGGLVPSVNMYAIRINSDVCKCVERNGNIVQEILPQGEENRRVGFIILFDANEGKPLAIFPDGYIQRLRVGATSAIGAELLAREDASMFGLLGVGVQAEGQVAAIIETFDIDSVIVFSPTRQNREEFANYIESKYYVSTKAVDNPREVFQSDIVHSATNSHSPVFNVEWVKPGTHLGSINVYEIDQRALGFCDVTIVHSTVGKENDYWTSTVDTEDIPYLGPQKQEYDSYPSLGDFIIGQADGRPDEEAVTFFLNNIGIGAQFAAVGGLVYQHAVEQDIGRDLSFEYLTS